MKKSVFREYDIRGVYGTAITEDFARGLGVAYAQLMKEMLGEKESYLVGIGQDCRTSGPSLVAALVEGLVSQGVNVLKCGMGATPQLYFSVFNKSLDGGIQVTASHNPGDQNGFKMMVGKTTLSGDLIQKLREFMESTSSESAATPGQVSEYDAASDYLKEIVSNCQPHMGERKLKVVVDGGNGVGGPVGVQALRDLGCEVIELYTEPDGTFPNHHPDPTVVENLKDLRALVIEQGADAGIAWDGDADRIGVVDEKGTPIFGDMLLLIFGKSILPEVPHPTVIGDVKCSQLLFDTLEEMGAKGVMARTGHSLIKAKLKELNAELAGEMSGHMFFAHRYYGFDDALYSAARFCEILSNTDKACSELLAGLPKVYSTPEIRVDCDDAIKFEVVNKVVDLFSDYDTNTIDGVRVTFSDGWGLVRASNTQAALVMRFESEREEGLDEYRALFESKIESVKESLAK